MAKIVKIDDKFYFDEENGTEAQEVKVWVEISKKSAKHPEGKSWIKLPVNNVTNRRYFSLDKFEEMNVNGEVIVEVKTTAPRVLGASGVNQKVLKYLDEDMAAEYTTLVETAIAKYKEAKASVHKKKPEEMTLEELEAYLEALKTGTTVSIKDGPKSFIDCMSDEEYNRYNELLAISAENKANAPKAVRGPLTEEQKAARKEKTRVNNISKVEALLAALRAQQGK